MSLPWPDWSTATWEKKLSAKKFVEAISWGSADSGNHGHAGRPGQVGGSAPSAIKDTLFGKQLDPDAYHDHAVKLTSALDDAHKDDPTWDKNVAAVRETMSNFPMIHTAQLGNIPAIEANGIRPAHEFNEGFEFDKISGLDRTVFMRMGQAGGGGHGAVGVIVDPTKLEADQFIITKLGAMTMKAKEDPFLRTPGDHSALVSNQLKPYTNTTVGYKDLHDVQSRLLVHGYEKDHPEARGTVIDAAKIINNDHGEMEVKYAGAVPPKAIIAYFAGDQKLSDFGDRSAYDYLKGKVPDAKLVKYQGEGLHELSAAYRAHYANPSSRKLVEAIVWGKRRGLFTKAVAFGGEGSGNHGHAGRPGEVGGSGSGGGSAQDNTVTKVRGQFEALGLPSGVDDNPNAIRAAAAVAPILREMKDRGYLMPKEVEVRVGQSLTPAITGEATNDILRIKVPESLPPELTLDQAVEIAYGGKTAAGIPRFVGNTFKDVVVHEIGHINTKTADEMSPQEMKANLSALRGDKFLAAPYVRAASHVSDYASHHPDEFVAEAFALKYRGEKLPSDVEKIYTALGGPKLR